LILASGCREIANRSVAPDLVGRGSYKIAMGTGILVISTLSAFLAFSPPHRPVYNKTGLLTFVFLGGCLQWPVIGRSARTRRPRLNLRLGAPGGRIAGHGRGKIWRDALHRVWPAPPSTCCRRYNGHGPPPGGASASGGGLCLDGAAVDLFSGLKGRHKHPRNST